MKSLKDDVLGFIGITQWGHITRKFVSVANECFHARNVLTHTHVTALLTMGSHEIHLHVVSGTGTTKLEIRKTLNDCIKV
jgi:hypothetical protein